MNQEKPPKNWSCSSPNCNKVFKHKQSLNNHKKSCKHATVRSSSTCGVCNKSFCRPTYLKAHKCKGALDNSSLVCTICFKDFKKKCFLQRHMRQAHKERFKCSSCEKTFEREAFFIRHQLNCQRKKIETEIDIEGVLEMEYGDLPTMILNEINGLDSDSEKDELASETDESFEVT